MSNNVYVTPSETSVAQETGPIAFRFKGGRLQQGFHQTFWGHNLRGKIVWRDVPSVAADAPDEEVV